MSEEEWRPVVGHEGSYEVSSLGRVRSLDRRVPVRKDKSVTRFARGAVLKPSPTRSGHLQVYVGGSTASVHRMVALAFLGPPPPGKPNALHWDDDPTNNRVGNLRWGSQAENIRDIVRNGNHYGANQTHCKYGHEYTPENTYTRTGKSGRFCKRCTLRRQSQTLNQSDPRHGSYAGYTAGCRCEGCRQAKREYSKDYWRSKHGKGEAYRD